MQVFVRDNNVDQALKVLKRRLQREGVFREMKRKRFYEKPSERSAREKSEAIRRIRKLKRKQAQREGLLLDPVYSGKAMAGLIDLVRSRHFAADETIVFIHTGGSPAMFAYADQF